MSVATKNDPPTPRQVHLSHKRRTTGVVATKSPEIQRLMVDAFETRLAVEPLQWRRAQYERLIRRYRAAIEVAEGAGTSTQSRSSRSAKR